MPPIIPAPNPPNDGIDGACYFLAANVLAPELVVPNPNAADGTLRSVVSQPPPAIAPSDLPICVLSAHGVEYAAAAAGVAGSTHKIMATVFIAQWTQDADLGDLEVLARRYAVTVPQAITAHIRMSRSAADPGSRYIARPVRGKIGPASYAGYAGEGVATATDTVKYECFQLEIAVSEKEVRTFGS